MVVTTRITFATEPLLSLDRHEPPPCTGPPSSVRIRCAVTRRYSSRRLAGDGLAVPDRRADGPVTGEQTFYVYDPALFLRYDDASRAVHGMLAQMPPLAGVDLSPENWQPHFAPAALASRMLRHAQTDDDGGGGGGNYHFAVHMAVEVRFEFIEPKAMVQACAETFMQTLEPGSENRCTICMESLENDAASGGAMAPVNLPCFHGFHTRCITVWLFKGRKGTCPVCRHDLRDMPVSRPPWVSSTRTPMFWGNFSFSR
ncbi:hypothetical protein EJB05_15744, partial [Eragrostis curvula]